MLIKGIGILGAFGRGMESFRAALESGWKKPEKAYTIPPEALRDPVLTKDMRRADDLCKMAVLAASDALADGGLGSEEKSSLGIILGTAFGPHPTTFRFLDDIISFREPEVSPTTFSHSVHNAALSYVSYLLQSRGPTLTVTQFAHSFHQSVSLAQAWLDEGRCENVLVGTADQFGTVMDYICSQKLVPAEDGRIKPFSCSARPVSVPGEGCVFFLVTGRQNAERSGGRAYASLRARQDGTSVKADLTILDADGMTGDESGYLDFKDHCGSVASYTPVYGSLLTGGGFSCAAAALMIRDRCRFASPVQDNPHGFDLVAANGPAELNFVRCVKFGCRGERIEFSLERIS